MTVRVTATVVATRRPRSHSAHRRQWNANGVLLSSLKTIGRSAVRTPVSGQEAPYDAVAGQRYWPSIGPARPRVMKVRPIDGPMRGTVDPAVSVRKSLPFHRKLGRASAYGIIPSIVGRTTNRRSGATMNPSRIEWTGATWNPVTGCTKVSPGCDHCYAETFAKRWRRVPGHPYEHGFDLQLRPERMGQPLSWKRPGLIFVNSMSDLFHADVPVAYIAEVAATMRAASWHTFQVLTKRAERLERLSRRIDWSDNVWLGVSVEAEPYYSRISHLQRAQHDSERPSASAPSGRRRHIGWVSALLSGYL